MNARSLHLPNNHKFNEIPPAPAQTVEPSFCKAKDHLLLRKSNVFVSKTHVVGVPTRACGPQPLVDSDSVLVETLLKSREKKVI